METNKNMTAWSVSELSDLYHLTMWGYTAKEIGEKLIELNYGRTKDSINAQVCNMRKYISKELGFPVQNWDVGPHTEAKFLQASNSGISAIILPFKRNKSVIASKEVVRTPIPAALEHHEVTAPVISVPQPIVPQPVVEKEPDILDVMKMAKELGAAEVEYKGMKIKY